VLPSDCSNIIKQATTQCSLSIGGKFPGMAMNGVLSGIAHWVGKGAAWLLRQLGGLLTSTTKVNLKAGWFTHRYRIMALVAGSLALPLLMLSTIQAILRQDASSLVRSFFVSLPAAGLLTGAGVELVSMGVALVNELSRELALHAGLDAGNFMGKVIVLLAAVKAPDPDVVALPAFVLFLGALAVAMGAFALWLELALRSAAIYVAVLFLPLALAGMLWPATAHWVKRFVELLSALILSKLVVVGVLSLAASALGGSSGAGGLAGVVSAVALLALSACSPFVLFALVPALEAGGLARFEGVSRRVASPVTERAGNLGEDLVGKLVEARGWGASSSGSGPIDLGELAGRNGDVRPYLDYLAGDQDAPIDQAAKRKLSKWLSASGSHEILIDGIPLAGDPLGQRMSSFEQSLGAEQGERQ
jgi:hypothetical protein